MSFPFIRQSEYTDCGPTCLRMIAEYYGKSFSQKAVNNICKSEKNGTTLYEICKTAKALGFNAIASKTTLHKFYLDQYLPCICLWQNKHYVIVYKITKLKVFVADPAVGMVTYDKIDFINNWVQKREQDPTQDYGIVLYLEPTKKFLT